MRMKFEAHHYRPHSIGEFLWGWLAFNLHPHLRLEPPNEVWLALSFTFFGWGAGIDLSADRTFGYAAVEVYADYPGGNGQLEIAWESERMLEEETEQDDDTD